MKKVNISMVRGDTLTFDLIVHSDQDLQNVYFTAASNSSGDYIFSKNNKFHLVDSVLVPNGIDLVSTQVVEQSNMFDSTITEYKHNYVVTVNPEDTASAALGDYVYDLRVSTNGDVFTFLYGILSLLPDKLPAGDE